MTLEKMGEFFDTRLDIYDDHQLNCIANATDFYPFTASLLPDKSDCNLLDLGCGTGLELKWYFKKNPTANVTGVDLATGMLNSLKTKFSDMKLTLINKSYFDVEFNKNSFDAVVSVESLHHFTKELKISLYKNIFSWLKNSGYFILTDYFSYNQNEENARFKELSELKKAQNIKDTEFYHYDTPLTINNELDALKTAGFLNISVLKSWGATSVIKASK